ncbi:MAG: sugar-transfer associated ATP-grasp domain-containing protein [Pseudomonadota bacterium]
MRTMWRPWLTCKDAKPIFEQIREVVWLWRRYDRFPRDYFRMQAYRVGGKAYKQIIPRSTVRKARDWIRPTRERIEVSDKRLFRKIMEAAALPVVREVLFIEDGVVMDSDDVRLTRNIARDRILAEPNGVFIKPIDGSLGRNTFVASNDTFLDEFSFQGGWLVQPRLNQHPDLNRLFPNSINTLRVHSYVENDTVLLDLAILRMGSGQSIVDNASSGGLHASVDLNTGRLLTLPTQKYDFDPTGKVYPVHPDTGTDMTNFTVPMIDQIRDWLRQLLCNFQGSSRWAGTLRLRPTGLF